MNHATSQGAKLPGNLEQCRNKHRVALALHPSLAAAE